MATVERLSGSGNWTCPTGVTSVQVECYGGGSSGVKAVATKGGAGGQGGGYAKLNTLAVTPGNTYPYVVGAGGGVCSSTVTRNKGADTTFNTSSCVAVGAGQTTTQVGDVKYTGGTYAVVPAGNNGGSGGGASGGPGGTGGNGGAPSGNTGGPGGTAQSGGYDGAAGGNQNSVGNNATGYGAGGGGGGSNTAQNGGSGSNGTIVLTYTAAALPMPIFTLLQRRRHA